MPSASASGSGAAADRGGACHNHAAVVKRRALAALACGFVIAQPPAWADGLALQRVAWRELRYTAHKMGMSATVEVRLDDGAPRSDLAEGATAPVPGDGLLLESTTRLPGRVFLARERIDPAQARVRRIVDTETGAKYHRKTYTLTSHGFLLEVLEPASRAESKLAPERWTRAARSFTPYPRELAEGVPITGPIGLLYAASAASLTSPGDELTVLVLVQTHVERVTLRVESVETVALQFEERSGSVVTEVHEERSGLRLVARSRPVDPSSTSAFRIFGLGGDVELLWDPVRRLPLEIAGNVTMLGRVHVRLAAVTLRPGGRS